MVARHGLKKIWRLIGMKGKKCRKTIEGKNQIKVKGMNKKD